jgi:Ribosomal protein L22p/L17e
MWTSRPVSLPMSMYRASAAKGNEGTFQEQLEMNKKDALTPAGTHLATDPDPASRVRWHRRKVIQLVRRRGVLTPQERIKMTERELLHKSDWMMTSTKKLTMLARQISGKTLDDAITQMQWSKKKMARGTSSRHATSPSPNKAWASAGSMESFSSSPQRFRPRTGSGWRFATRPKYTLPNHGLAEALGSPSAWISKRAVAWARSRIPSPVSASRIFTLGRVNRIGRLHRRAERGEDKDTRISGARSQEARQWSLGTPTEQEDLRPETVLFMVDAAVRFALWGLCGVCKYVR